MSGHTPGPWKVAIGSNPFCKSLVALVEQSPERFIAVYADGSADPLVKREEWEANARLIAAAPDLLACAREALKYVEEDEWGNPVDEAYCSPGYAAHLRALRAAIAKAEGR